MPFGRRLARKNTSKSSTTSSNANSSNATSTNATDTNDHNAKLVSIFNNYKDADSGRIEVEGTIKYLEDLELGAEDVESLLLAHLLGSPSTGVFEKEKFVYQWSYLGIFDLDSMKVHLQELREKFNNTESYFKEIYEFTFTFSLEPRQKFLSKESAIEYWDFLLSKKYPREVEIWSKFMTEKWEKAVSKDTWNMLYDFVIEFAKDPKLEQYDEMAAWPSVIDEFVEWFKEERS